MNKYTKARKYALQSLMLNENTDMSYKDIAKRIAFKDNAIVEFSLDDKEHAKAFLLTWADRKQFKDRNKNGIHL